MEFRAQISIFGFYYNRQLPSDQTIIRWLSKWSTLDNWMCAIFSLVFAYARHLFRNNTATFAQSIRSFFEILPFELTSDLYCHTCVLSLILCTHYLTIQMMHTIENHLSNGFTSIAVIPRRALSVCVCMYCFFRLLRSLSISRRMDHRLDVNAFDSVQHFDSKRFDSVCCTHHFHKTNIA